jgi:hypothetical protein
MTETTIDTLKSLLYGKGRGTGIRIVPKNYDGAIGTQVEGLVQDVVTAQKDPPDAEDATVLHLGNDLARALEFHAGFNVIADALTRYVQARVEWTGRGAIE